MYQFRDSNVVILGTSENTIPLCEWFLAHDCASVYIFNVDQNSDCKEIVDYIKTTNDAIDKDVLKFCSIDIHMIGPLMCHGFISHCIDDLSALNRRVFEKSYYQGIKEGKPILLPASAILASDKECKRQLYEGIMKTLQKPESCADLIELYSLRQLNNSVVSATTIEEMFAQISDELQTVDFSVIRPGYYPDELEDGSDEMLISCGTVDSEYLKKTLFDAHFPIGAIIWVVTASEIIPFVCEDDIRLMKNIDRFLNNRKEKNKYE